MQLPVTVVELISEAAVERARYYINRHPGGEKNSAERTWRDEVGAGVEEGADEILREYLPPVLLARWGVAN